MNAIFVNRYLKTDVKYILLSAALIINRSNGINDSFNADTKISQVPKTVQFLKYDFKMKALVTIGA